MFHHRLRWHRFWLGLCAVPFLIVDAPVAVAAKIKMAFPGPVTTFSLPYLVAQKKGWMDGLEVEDVHVTGDANAALTWTDQHGQTGETQPHNYNEGLG